MRCEVFTTGTQLLLKSRNLVTQRRLHDEAPFRRAGEVAELCHGDDVSQLLEVHPAIVDRDHSHDNIALESSLAMPQAVGMRSFIGCEGRGTAVVPTAWTTNRDD
jgi:hypothetical protein